VSAWDADSLSLRLASTAARQSTLRQQPRLLLTAKTTRSASQAVVAVADLGMRADSLVALAAGSRCQEAGVTGRCRFGSRCEQETGA
jgi:hypothetical protein